MTDRNQPEAASHLSPHLRDLKKETLSLLRVDIKQIGALPILFLDYRDYFDDQGPLWAVANDWRHTVCLAALSP